MKKARKRRDTAKFKTLQDARLAKAYFRAVMNFTLGPVELRRRLQLGDVLNIVDVRRNSSFCEAHIPGAFSLPREAWESAEGLSKDRINVIYCGSQNCHLAPEACLYYAGLGYPVMHLDGGMEAWQAAGFDVETIPAMVEEPAQQDSVQAA